MRMDKYTTGASYGWGSFTTMLGAITLNDWAIIVGIACTLGTFLVNSYYKRKDYELRKGNGGQNAENTQK
ncbi:phage holin family protein [Entomohabitans teleogrylli]|uniref:phage holin family protein n=1 Tax=Entomohabitans teleogrylli TaxID=1384589 RepID=UPI00073D88C4|nr:phage holin family protein [Entomohabitans teleogrylli]